MIIFPVEDTYVAGAPGGRVEGLGSSSVVNKIGFGASS